MSVEIGVFLSVGGIAYWCGGEGGVYGKWWFRLELRGEWMYCSNFCVHLFLLLAVDAIYVLGLRES